MLSMMYLNKYKYIFKNKLILKVHLSIELKHKKKQIFLKGHRSTAYKVLTEIHISVPFRNDRTEF